MKKIPKKPDYGNWVSAEAARKCAAWFLVFGVLDAVLWVFLRGLYPLKSLLALPALLFLTCALYFRAAWRHFSDEGGNVQNKVIDMLISHIAWDGKGRAPDIGCGSGRLAVRLAKKFSDAAITGVDSWGVRWGYYQKQCEENAALEGVGNRTEFVRGSATELPFPDGAFDLAVSNLTFHEVRESQNKLDVVREALRVVKKGGRFVFQDLFLLKSLYGTPDELAAAVTAMGAKNIRFVNTGKSPFIPASLKLPFMLGALGLIYGEKE
jgi:SAM-dependent methyltransferase